MDVDMAPDEGDIKMDGSLKNSTASASMLDAHSKQNQSLDRFVQLSFGDPLRPLYVTLEVACVDRADKSDSQLPNSNVSSTTAPFQQPLPISHGNDADISSSAPLKRKPDPGPNQDTARPIKSSLQMNEIQLETLKPAKKKRCKENLNCNEVVEQGKGNNTVRMLDQHTGDQGSLVWNDLELDDSDDPTLVTEYSTEIFAYLKDAEMPDPEYINYHDAMTWESRGALIDLVIQLHHRVRGLPETLFLCVNIIDRFLTRRMDILGDRLTLLAVSAYTVATKYEDRDTSPSMADLSTLEPWPDGKMSPKMLFTAEIALLKSLGWDISAPGPLTWLRRGSIADDCEIQARTVAKYLMEVALVDHRMLKFTPSLVAAAALWLGRLKMGRMNWTADLEHHTTYAEKEHLLPAQIILEQTADLEHHTTYAEKEHLLPAQIILEQVLTFPRRSGSAYKAYSKKQYFRVHEIIAPGIFKLIAPHTFPQNQQCVVRAYFTLPHGSYTLSGREEELKAINARISTLDQEIQCLKRQMDELMRYRDSMTSAPIFDGCPKPTQPLDRFVQLSLGDALRPIYLTLEVAYLDKAEPKPPNFIFSSDSAPPQQLIPIGNGNNADTSSSVPLKRKRESDMDLATPITSSSQVSEIKQEALKRERKKQRKDIPNCNEVVEQMQLEGNDTVQMLEPDTDDLRMDSSAWNDLELEESGDLTMVTEYSSEIIEYLKNAEKEMMPDPAYIDQQGELTWDSRAVLMNQITQLHHKVHGIPETIFLCVNIIDRYLTRRAGVWESRLSLLALTAYVIAAKYEQGYAPPLTVLSTLVPDGSVCPKKLFIAEVALLESLDWNISAPEPLTWLRRGSKADDYDIHSRTVAKYLMEVALVDHRMLQFTPSLVAAAAMWLGRLKMGRMNWTADLEHYTTYAENELLLPAQIILEQVLTFPCRSGSAYKAYSKKRWTADLEHYTTYAENELLLPAQIILEQVLTFPRRSGSAYKAYSKKQYFRASKCFTTWAEQRWKQNSEIDLERDLQALKDGKLKAENASIPPPESAME
ncbi:hypothetical protein CVT24_011104 [Panaeolus cyanescens]|uniref:Cyclin N-terminal domain-containing protein n=1 Tax=Panaeolus cyanescens TaxID=181874 RepID=A0A409YG58_9AGAR|nr:hypothetical protein CVT24_011104 [Panaeolus cyanescens]